jgi:aminoglycoside phosphotransferase (APT) family kinase protein
MSVETPPETAEVRAGQELDWDRLAAYLHDNLAGLASDVHVAQFPNGVANLTYLIRFGERQLVVRRPPFGVLAPGSHDMRREYRVLSRLWEVFPPAPRALLFCDDHDVIGSDFLVSEYRAGQVIWGALPPSMAAYPDAGRRIGFALIDTLAALHQVDPAACGLEELGRPEGYVARQVSGWRHRWDLVADGSPDAAVMERLSDGLAASLPDSGVHSLIHNDYKMDNCQFDPADPDHVHSVFDWDMATLGDPLMDFGTALTYWWHPSDTPDDRSMAPDAHAELGLPTRAEIVARYEQRTGFDVSKLSWYEAFACFKTAVVLRQLYVRWLRGETTDPRMEERGPKVAPLARRGARILGV